MVRHTQTIRRQEPTNCLSVFDQFVELALKVLKSDQALNPCMHNVRTTTFLRYVWPFFSIMCERFEWFELDLY